MLHYHAVRFYSDSVLIALLLTNTLVSIMYHTPNIKVSTHKVKSEFFQSSYFDAYVQAVFDTECSSQNVTRLVCHHKHMKTLPYFYSIHLNNISLLYSQLQHPLHFLLSSSVFRLFHAVPRIQESNVISTLCIHWRSDIKILLISDSPPVEI